MTDNETVDENTVDIENNLEDFEKDFYGKKEEAPATKDEPEEVADEEAEEEVVEESEEVDDLAPEDEEANSDEEEEEEEPQPKKKKHSAQERINELTAKARQAEREVEALRREMETLKAVREKEEPEPLRTQLPPEAPNPDALDKEGNPIYELGEFDPKYIRDLTKFTIAEETKKANEERAQQEWNEGVAAAQQELAEQWVEKVEKAEESIPTLREDITALTDTFESIDPNYGEYLAMTIMQCDNGPEIMHYFSNNIGEAQKIVAAGPAAATLAIGRLEAMFTKQPSTEQDEQKRNNKKKVSNAPTPPEGGARGVHGRQVIRPDTDNLEAFEEIFYPNRKK